MSFLSRIMVLKSKAHFSAGPRGFEAENGQIFQGVRKTSGQQARSRIAIMIGAFTLVYAVIGGRLVYYGMTPPEMVSSIRPADNQVASRPDILDRNGEILATDVRTVSLFAEPHKIVDPDEAVELLSTVLPNLDRKAIYKKLTASSRFQWLQRQLTPKQQSEILSLGIPGVGFRPAKRRFYPAGDAASHVVGYVNIDNRGVAGMEKYLDNQGLADLAAIGMTSTSELEPVKLSIDLRVQNIVHDEIKRGLADFDAIGAGAVVLDVNTGEVLGMASVPDFDPNNPGETIDLKTKSGMNRMSGGVFEMGSTFKAFTTAMALDSGKVSMNDTFDARKPLYIGGFTIHDFHATRRILSVRDVFIHSSNIGSARMADAVGVEGHREFMTRLGLLTRMDTELPEVAAPSQPKTWKKITSMTVAFGHGVSTTPLQTAVAGAALMNGGKLLPPTFLLRDQERANEIAKVVVNERTVENMRYLFRANVLDGSGSRANIAGFHVGGKTGTAEKVVNGRYANNVRFNAFLSAFPVENPKYVVLTIVDEPKKAFKGCGVTAGCNAGVLAGNIIRRGGALLGVKAKFGPDGNALLVSY
ncbi:penicillin-binding protein 2 [Rhizobium sp. G21]|uniref:peptidoglycan D,D-transpeptidase FtsI family protein n=1 Tax=Rhizobium sp. G21 TaxID=2758439 RepID=UPI0016014A6E|nr:penicillin-binding protein 2 [Rhizobium sp. G21]MBB1250638.1 penicillin-binding protein 2 [Rhizobium sp. G21]